jgi:hypothetical protein
MSLGLLMFFRPKSAEIGSFCPMQSVVMIWFADRYFTNSSRLVGIKVPVGEGLRAIDRTSRLKK